MKSKKIAALNDKLRRSFEGGHVFLTPGIQELSDTTRQKVLQAVQDFERFTPDNDPHEEHDFGKIELDGETIFWKIDYYDLELRYASPDPADPAQTRRILTILLANEY